MSGLGLADVRSTISRSALLLGLALTLMIVPELTSDPLLRSIVPWFAVLFMLQIAPLMWARKPDLFAPPVLAGIMAALGTAASVAEMLVEGEVNFRLVSVATPEEAAALAQKVLLALLLGQVCYYIGYYTRLGV